MDRVDSFYKRDPTRGTVTLMELINFFYISPLPFPLTYYNHYNQ